MSTDEIYAIFREEARDHLGALENSFLDLERAQSLDIRRELIDNAFVGIADWARAQGCQLLTLTTYRDVPWNAPYYTRLGFRECALDQLGREHREVWEGQRAMGLCMERRLLMARAL